MLGGMLDPILTVTLFDGTTINLRHISYIDSASREVGLIGGQTLTLTDSGQVQEILEGMQNVKYDAEFDEVDDGSSHHMRMLDVMASTFANKFADRLGNRLVDKSYDIAAGWYGGTQQGMEDHGHS